MGEKYLSIGKVAKLKNVSIKSLRYYDEIGIFCPSYINPSTNYRYYTESQLPILDAVNLCVEIGIPLKQLHYYVTDNSLDFQRLLGDGQTLANTKISSMKKAIAKLKKTAANCGDSLPLSPLAPAIEAACEAEAVPCVPNAAPASVQIEREESFFLAVPMDEFATPQYYGQYILKLFIFARQLNVNATYPSGVLYRREYNETHKYMCLSLPRETNPVFPDTSIHQEVFIFCLPKDTYYQRLIHEHISMQSFSIFGSNSIKHSYSLMELDIIPEDKNIPEDKKQEKPTIQLLWGFTDIT